MDCGWTAFAGNRATLTQFALCGARGYKIKSKQKLDYAG